MLGRAVARAKQAVASRAPNESLGDDGDLSSSLKDFSENDLI